MGSEIAKTYHHYRHEFLPSLVGSAEPASDPSNRVRANRHIYRRKNIVQLFSKFCAETAGMVSRQDQRPTEVRFVRIGFFLQAFWSDEIWGFLVLGDRKNTDQPRNRVRFLTHQIVR